MTEFNFDDIDTDTPEIGNVIGTVATEEAETAAPVAKPKKAKPVKTVTESKPKRKKTISVSLSAEDYERVMTQLDGRPARTVLGELIIKAMFGDKT